MAVLSSSVLLTHFGGDGGRGRGGGGLLVAPKKIGKKLDVGVFAGLQRPLTNEPSDRAGVWLAWPTGPPRLFLVSCGSHCPPAYWIAHANRSTSESDSQVRKCSRSHFFLSKRIFVAPRLPTGFASAVCVSEVIGLTRIYPTYLNLAFVIWRSRQQLTKHAMLCGHLHEVLKKRYNIELSWNVTSLR